MYIAREDYITIVDKGKHLEGIINTLQNFENITEERLGKAVDKIKRLLTASIKAIPDENLCEMLRSFINTLTYERTNDSWSIKGEAPMWQNIDIGLLLEMLTYGSATYEIPALGLMDEIREIILEEVTK